MVISIEAPKMEKSSKVERMDKTMLTTMLAFCSDTSLLVLVSTLVSMTQNPCFIAALLVLHCLAIRPHASFQFTISDTLHSSSFPKIPCIDTNRSLTHVNKGTSITVLTRRKQSFKFIVNSEFELGRISHVAVERKWYFTDHKGFLILETTNDNHSLVCALKLSWDGSQNDTYLIEYKAGHKASKFFKNSVLLDDSVNEIHIGVLQLFTLTCWDQPSFIAKNWNVTLSEDPSIKTHSARLVMTQTQYTNMKAIIRCGIFVFRFSTSAIDGNTEEQYMCWLTVAKVSMLMISREYPLYSFIENIILAFVNHLETNIQCPSHVSTLFYGTPNPALLMNDILCGSSRYLIYRNDCPIFDGNKPVYKIKSGDWLASGIKTKCMCLFTQEPEKES